MARIAQKSRIVQKFGGTSVGDIGRIKRVVSHVKNAVDAGHEVAVVVSAMAGVTDDLVATVGQAADDWDSSEYDSVVSCGEQICSGLFALALQQAGVPARSWLAWQVPVRTDGVHCKARIQSIETDVLAESMAQGQVAVVAGFQGLGPSGRLTTLGRGGSDTTAVALATALDADRCEIFTDVDGIYTADPRIVAKARKLDKITYEEMLEMASLGAKVLQTRAVELAMKYHVPVHVLSSFRGPPGTLLIDEDDFVEQHVVSGIAYSRDEAQITLVSVLDKPGIAAAVFGPLAEANVNVDMIVQNVSEDGANTDLTFTVGKADVDRAVGVLRTLRDALHFRDVVPDSNVVKISVIGVGMRSHAGVANRMFQALADKSINIKVIATSEIKISVLIAEEYCELALRTLHTAYGLDSA